MPIVRDGEPRAPTNRANTNAKCFATPSLKRRGGVKASCKWLTTKVEHGGISAGANALGFAAVRADEGGADRNLRKLSLAVNV